MIAKRSNIKAAGHKLLVIASVLAIVGAPVASPVYAGGNGGATITFTKLVDNFDPLPDEPTRTFIIPGGSGGPPAQDGDIVVFAVDENPNASLWAADLSSGSLTRLFDLASNNLGINPFSVSNGTAAFRAHAGEPNTLFSISAQGGTPITLANQDTPIPDMPDTPFGGDAFSFISIDGDNVVFSGRALSGIYRVSAGGDPIASIGNNTFICEAGYGGGGLRLFRVGTVSGDTVAMVVQDGGTAVYTAPLSGVIGVQDSCAPSDQLRASNVTRIGSLNVAVPGDPQGRNFDAFLGFGIALIDGPNIVFEGGAGLDLFGIYGVTPDGLVKLVDTSTPVPGGTGNFQSFPGFPQQAYTLSGGNVVFRGADATGKEGLYLVSATGGDITKVVATGDSLGDGRTVSFFFQPPIQPKSLSGNRLAFRVHFDDPVLGSGDGIYLAILQ